ncbi:hypothetical protein ACI6Q2_17865 [Chitinophagaceae bacterium LWZ2-11]
MLFIKSPLYLQIPKPCHEDWNKMIPTQQGRFCTGCNKQVIDFSLMTDQQVLNYFNNSKGEICGRVSKDQLDKPFYHSPESKKKNWRRFVTCILSLLVIETTEAQKKKTILGSPQIQQEQEQAFKLRTERVEANDLQLVLAVKDLQLKAIEIVPQQVLSGFAGGISITRKPWYKRILKRILR